MVQSLQLGNPPQSGKDGGMKRLNRVPIFLALGIMVLFFGFLFYGLSSRGLRTDETNGTEEGSQISATSYAEQMKRGVKDGIIGDQQGELALQPAPEVETKSDRVTKPIETKPPTPIDKPVAEPQDDWRARLQREDQEQVLRERQRRRMAMMQAEATALDSPLKVNITALREADNKTKGPELSSAASDRPDLYSAALQAGLGRESGDQNGQVEKQDFLANNSSRPGYLNNRVTPQQSSFELKRGSVLPATLVTGINSDLPGRITAQVSQNVYDSATGHYLLIPQGAKLFGRYDSKVSFGQSRVLVVWTDIIFPNGSTLQIGGMAGTEAAGYGGFADEVDNHYFRTFGSAVLVALIGTGIDMAVPESSTLSTQSTASDAARRNFAETFGRVAEQTVSKNLNTQPTIEIRPGYQFNVLVDQDIVFPASYQTSL